MIRPGPPSIDPGRSPGGVVFHAYDDSGRLLATDHVAPGDDVQAHAERTADAAFDDYGAELVVLVAYDGDTGARFTVNDWTSA